MFTFISEVNNRNHGIIVNFSHSSTGEWTIDFYFNKKMSGVNYFSRPQTIESSKLGPSMLEL
jgi:hypothetical protein